MSFELENTILEEGLEGIGRFYGFYRGEIVDNMDPEKMGRLKLKVPQIHGEDIHDYWAFPIGMFTGNNIGFFAVPNIGDMVWVSFEMGDPSYPLWTYGYNRKGETIDYAKEDYTKRAVFQTTSGNKITSKDKERKLEFQQADGTAIDIKKNKINLGKLDNADEPAVLGDKAVNENQALADLIMEILDELVIETHLTPAGLSAVPMNAAKYAAIKVKVTAWKTKNPTIKSKIVRLD